MRRRILFQKGVCSLLALLLAFSSLMALPALAVEEDGTVVEATSGESGGTAVETGSEENQNDGGETNSEEDNQTGNETNSGEDSQTDNGTNSGEDNQSDNGTNSGEDNQTGNETNVEENNQTGNETNAGENNQTDNGTGSGEKDQTDNGTNAGENGQTGDGTNTGENSQTGDETNVGENNQTDNGTGSGENGQPDNGTNAGENNQTGEITGPVNQLETGMAVTSVMQTAANVATGINPELQAELELEKQQKAQPTHLDVAREPVSVEDDELVLRATAGYYLGANLIFSSDPTKEFMLQVQSSGDYKFYCNWSEINDSRVSVEIIPPMDSFIVVLRLPFDFLADYGITLTQADGITFNSQRYSLDGLDLPDKTPPVAPIIPGELPPYEGISIDGNFDDWAGVVKTDLRNPNSAWPCTMQCAVVWDGDYVYIYLHVDDGNASAVGAMGTHSNGQYGITTDLGNIRLVQPDFGNNSVEIYGIDDALVAVDNYNWDPVNGHSTEIAIPTSRLPKYRDSISFGYYQVEPFLKGIVNLNPVQEEIKESSDFACDGTFGEWTYYPHTLIEYDTAGQQDSKVDGGAALNVVNGMLYGHVKTAHIDHLAENGSEFLADIEIAFNGDLAWKALPEQGNFYPKMFTEDGTKVANEGTSNPNGITTYLISDVRETTPEPGPYFGVMKISINGTVDEMEFAIDLAKVAEYIGCDASDFKTVHARFGRIGDEWVTTAGTPTGPVLGLALCFATVGGVYAVDRKKKKK